MDKTQKHRILCEKINKMYHYKNEEYGDSFSASIQKYGYIAALTRISDKFHEFEHLILSKDNGPDTNEAIIDTCLNAANYFLMTIIELESDEDKKCKNNCDYFKDLITTPTDYDKAISNTTAKEDSIDLWKSVKDTKPTQLDWEYTDDYCTSDIKKKELGPSIEPEWKYDDLTSTADNRKKKQILCE